MADASASASLASLAALAADPASPLSALTAGVAAVLAEGAVPRQALIAAWTRRNANFFAAVVKALRAEDSSDDGSSVASAAPTAAGVRLPADYDEDDLDSLDSDGAPIAPRVRMPVAPRRILPAVDGDFEGEDDDDDDDDEGGEGGEGGEEGDDYDSDVVAEGPGLAKAEVRKLVMGELSGAKRSRVL